MRLEKWFISNLDDSQRKIIIQSITDDIIVQGAAGSGKTNLAIHRALQAKNKGSYAIVIFTVALKRMIAYGMQALGLDKERIAYEWAWTHRGFDLTGDVYWEKGNRNTLKFFTLSLFCLLVTAHHVLCSLAALAKSNMLVSTVALSKIFTPAKSIKSIGFVFLAKKSRVFSPYPARIHLLEVM